MSDTLEALAQQAMALSLDERSELIERLATSVMPAAALHPAWQAELARRAAELASGKATPVPADQVLGRLRATVSSVEPGQ
jgi:putative addiction module component (TIGR02574 family)